MVTADDARTLRSNKGIVNHQTYKLIYERIQHRIQYAAKKGYTQTEYTIPPIVPGRPMYDVSHAVRYTRDKLRYNGFKVTEVHPDVLLIDWKPKKGTFVPNLAAAATRPQETSPLKINESKPPPARKKKQQNSSKILDTLESLKSKLNM